MYLIPPHVFSIPLAIFVLLVVEFVSEFDNLSIWWQSMLDGKSTLPAARVGPAFLAVLIVPLFTLLAAIARLFTLAGLKALVRGVGLGITFGSLVDIGLLRLSLFNQANLSLYLNARLWAGYGAMGALGFCLWVGLFNPLLSRLGKHPTDGPGMHRTLWILSISGPILVLLSTVIGSIKITFFAQ